jgi:hypothetical protein
VLVAPRAAVSVVGLWTDALGLYFARSYGAGLLSLGVPMWLARDAGLSAARNAILIGAVLWLLIDAAKEV